MSGRPNPDDQLGPIEIGALPGGGGALALQRSHQRRGLATDGRRFGRSEPAVTSHGRNLAPVAAGREISTVEMGTVMRDCHP